MISELELRDGEQCAGCGHRNISHAYAQTPTGSGIGMGECGKDPCGCRAFQLPDRTPASEWLPGDVVVGCGWTIRSVAHRISTNPRLRVVIVEWEEGREENWAPSMFPATEAHPIERAGKPASIPAPRIPEDAPITGGLLDLLGLMAS
ncbi:hypothetical protein P2P98_08565 [Microbacterium sp. Kw_RZR3]|uniref:hypothetical protein n=1 Tax=Microbacterium sp. Kw_RZR3 TaxID=3032903 RepID=UPI0023D98BE6|nr:hypothetical protein [Microbacterium sp. Kw_RZR3]MDF2046209.1 hypothetical protein [Microbacterium sp. Kw_RZR3]